MPTSARLTRFTPDCLCQPDFRPSRVRLLSRLLLVGLGELLVVEGHHQVEEEDKDEADGVGLGKDLEDGRAAHLLGLVPLVAARAVGVGTKVLAAGNRRLAHVLHRPEALIVRELPAEEAQRAGVR
eukprot:CAMPEP_0196698414 /NCGR_PEP_ID=MMETSP1090-20130531/44523_1 /TAXON_ID=37098 /ORGANISM="Isochrysis sp, Strain CCMP1244" /LENGTH=125 /DNA_ID=CAMNT_0042038077 /DNA_START=217 /DNA_END=590 /DNA_ORIENTATION=-